MRITPKPLEINEVDPFSSDIFERKLLADSLTQIITDAEDENIVIGINAPWGEGKTTFAKMWKQQLVNNNYPVIYFDAFENDYVDNAFVTIARTVLEYSEEHRVSEERISSFKERAVRIGKMLVPAVSKMLVTAVTAGALKGKDLDSIGSEVQRIASEESEKVIEGYLNEKLESSGKDRLILSEFRSELNKISESLSTSKEKRPLIIILDELDRCKPTFAVQILESIKHLFSVKGVVFVLILNREQLQESIKSIYGVGIDAKTYLQKFLTLEIDFPKNKSFSKYQDSSDESTYCRLLSEQYGLKTDGGFYPYLIALSKLANLSLRDIEKIYSQLIWFRGDFFENHKQTPLITFLAFLKVIYPHVFIKLSQGRLTYQELQALVPILPNFGDDVSRDVEDERELNIIVGVLKACLYTDSAINKVVSARNDSILSLCLIRTVDGARAELIPGLCRRMNLLRVTS